MRARRLSAREASTAVLALAVLGTASLAPACDGGPDPKVPAAATTTASSAPSPPSSSAPPPAAPAPAGAEPARPSAQPAGAGEAPPVASERAGDVAPPAEIGARHVLVQWMGAERAPASVVRTKEQARAVAQRVRERALRGESLARLAVELSDEPGAGARGGSLGVFGKGKMVLAFEQAAFRLKVGEVSEIVESSFGFHVIVRTQ